MAVSKSDTHETGLSAWIIAMAMVLLVVSAIVAFYMLQVTRTLASGDVNEAREERVVELRAANLIQLVAASRVAMRAHVLQPDAETLRKYDETRLEAGASVRDLEALVAQRPELRADFIPVRTHFDRIATLTDAIIERSRIDGPRSSRIRAIGAEASEEILALQASAEALQEKARARAIALEDAVLEWRAQIDRLIAFLAILFLATIGFTMFWVYGERRALQRVATQLREANGALDGARQRAEDADAAKSRFLALASHDMRQPLHAITLYLAALRRRVETDQAKDIVAHMEMASQSLTRMFSGLLDLARIESGVLKARPVAFPLQDAFDAVAQEAKIDAASARTDLRIVRTSAEVFADSELLESILRNLLTNAFKYAPGGRVLIGCRRQGEHVRIEVRDEGPGIPKDKLVLVFGEFVRLDSAKLAGADGLGLGLSIAARLARLLGASLEVESEPGKGTCFHLTLPFAQKDATARAPDVSHGGVDLTGLRIAVKDDEPLALAAMERVLMDAGAQVDAYSDAAQYVGAVAAGARYDLVLGDPVLLRESVLVGGLDESQRPPVIVLTGATDAATIAAFDAANTELLIKPVPEALLLATAARVARGPVLTPR